IKSENRNPIAAFLKVASGIVVALGLGLTAVAMLSMREVVAVPFLMVFAICMILATVVSSLVIYGIGELIDVTARKNQITAEKVE
ncbi:MAG: hypothetical protein LBN00_08895, partial [Oscillospiraceae bacterium]|nr:hypothetical protein [Oscillospiraceae bacterium]